MHKNPFDENILNFFIGCYSSKNLSRSNFNDKNYTAFNVKLCFCEDLKMSRFKDGFLKNIK